MSGSLIAVARTPWAPRHTALDGRRPEVLLAAALADVTRRADIDAGAIDRILVACDTSVGAQDLNVGRRAAVEAGWNRTPALTVDGHGVTGLALVGLAAGLPGLTVVAGVDASSMVPPGAGLVRDYGRPTLEQPEHRWLESVASSADLSAAALDRAVEAAQAGVTLTNPSIVELTGGPAADTAVDQERGDPFEPEGMVAPHHLAPWADGAVAVLIAPSGGRAIATATLEALDDDEIITHLVDASAGLPRIVVDNNAVVASLAASGSDIVASPLAIGSAPSCDGLRALADAAATLDEGFEIRTRGGHGQVATVTIGSGDRLTDISKPLDAT